jgi:hypothetical protein
MGDIVVALYRSHTLARDNQSAQVSSFKNKFAKLRIKKTEIVITKQFKLAVVA